MQTKMKPKIKKYAGKFKWRQICWLILVCFNFFVILLTLFNKEEILLKVCNKRM